MNILLIGNGFDLSHGLPTTYRDFLSFVDVFLVKAEKKACLEESTSITDNVEEYINTLFSDCSKEKTRIELIELLDDNSWLRHFNSVNINSGWIDFESEISRVIQALDAARKNVEVQAKKKKSDTYQIEQWQCDAFQYVLGCEEALNSDYDTVSLDFFRIIPDKLYFDLNRLTRALEIYLVECVCSIVITDKICDIESISVDYLISFNYTNTYERVNEGIDTSQCDYLHGKVQEVSSLDDCNLVLGIDEYLLSPDRNTDNEYIRFKKFFQRIYKKTGCEYLKLIERIERNPASKLPNPPEHHLYIYGHSLDITDRDVLSKLIRVKNMKTVIFYHSKDAYATQIGNLVKVLGEDDLIEMVYGNNPVIRFVQQSN